METQCTETYNLSLHDALPILAPGMGWAVKEFSSLPSSAAVCWAEAALTATMSKIIGSKYFITTPSSFADRAIGEDRKSTRLNSSHSQISYAVFCLKKKKLLIW